ncbi:MAG: choice-of-anchor L domain-containing protein [Chitinophagaceae bacterium]|nr:choice-of-anchor L domain-containing protein [Chitinophagaceae bacterium]
MKTILKIWILFCCFIAVQNTAKAQLQIVPETTALALVQKLLGQGVTVTNVSMVADLRATGFFNNRSGTSIGIDSGIVLSTGRVKTAGTLWGFDGDGTTEAQNVEASSGFALPGDLDLANSISVPLNQTFDACVLEFDFVPLGDTIKFNYVFSSEEYTPAFVCDFNDAFAFFISGPGIPGLKNIALVPNTTLPVSIFNVNDVPGGGCPNNTAYYTDNRFNKFFTHDGHTTVFTAISQVQPCQTYHLKLVIADVIDDEYDSGVFIEARSLSSNAIALNNLTQTDNQGNSYLVEGCMTGSFQIKRPYITPNPLIVNLSYGGTAINGVDVQLLPASVIIPANDSMVTVNVLPVIDLAPEGIENLIIYALAGCASGNPSDSTEIQVRDYDTLGIIPTDTAFFCKGASIPLTASAGYSVYVWDANVTLSSTIIPNPVATPVADLTTYYCTATLGSCNARDSVTLIRKRLFLNTVNGVNCTNDATGEIRVYGSTGWISPVLFSVNNGPYQPDSVFINLPAGMYTIKIKDATGCIDSLDIAVTQLFPDLLISNLVTTPAGCSGTADGSVTITASGGNGPYAYSIDGINFQVSNFFNVAVGNIMVSVKDNNNCVTTAPVIIPLNNTVTLVAGADTAICEGKNYQLNPSSNGTSFLWTPSATLSNGNIINPIATPVITTTYYITATTGICTQTDSITVFVDPAPIPNAGADATVCFKTNYQLTGTGGVNYLWTPSTNLNDPAIFNPVVQEPVSSIIYYLAVVDAKGCNSLQDDSVSITVSAPAILYIGNDTTIAIRQPLQLFSTDVNNTGFINYNWSPVYGLNNPFGANPIAVLDRNITYYVTAVNAVGCMAMDTINIKVYQGPELYVPNAFTPNGDGLNDVLKVIAIGMKEFHFFRIYNRYGQLIFSTNDSGQGWDGRMSGKLQNMGTYVWMAEAVDYRGNLIQRNGSSTIVQ